MRRHDFEYLWKVENHDFEYLWLGKNFDEKKSTMQISLWEENYTRFRINRSVDIGSIGSCKCSRIDEKIWMSRGSVKRMWFYHCEKKSRAFMTAWPHERERIGEKILWDVAEVILMSFPYERGLYSYIPVRRRAFINGYEKIWEEPEVGQLQLFWTVWYRHVPCYWVDFWAFQDSDAGCDPAPRCIINAKA